MFSNSAKLKIYSSIVESVSGKKIFRCFMVVTSDIRVYSITRPPYFPTDFYGYFVHSIQRNEIGSPTLFIVFFLSFFKLSQYFRRHSAPRYLITLEAIASWTILVSEVLNSHLVANSPNVG